VTNRGSGKSNEANESLLKVPPVLQTPLE